MQTFVPINFTRHPHPAQWWTRTLRRLAAWSAITVLFYSAAVAQRELPFQNGEALNYDIHYTYGIAMIKAGYAYFKLDDTVLRDNKPTVRSHLDFKTTSFFDKLFKIRDTLRAFADAKSLLPMYHERSVNEGGTRFFEQLYFKYPDAQTTQLRMRRMSGERLRFDTVKVIDGLGYDMLNIFLFVRTLDFDNLQMETPMPLTAFVGRDQVKIRLRYKGQAVIEKNDTLKYKTLKFEVDIVDEVFSGEKNAMEIWISDDKNRIPLKLKAKLKIGAAEATLSSTGNLKHPFSSEIRLKRKNE